MLGIIKKLAIINKKGIKGPMKLGKTNKVVLTISNSWEEIDCCNSKILRICDNHIKPIKITMLIKIYFK